jgi:hypothetical protein
MNRLTYPYDETVSPALPFLEVEIEGYGPNRSRRALKAIIDSGADGTMFPLEMLSAVDAIYEDTVRLRGITGDFQQVDRYAITIYISELKIRGVHAVAVGTDDDALLGRDVLNELVLTLNGPAHTTEIAVA